MSRRGSIRRLRATYRNWLTLAFHLAVLSGPPPRVVLRDGTTLGPPARRGTVFALALARASGWELRGEDGAFLTLVPRDGVRIVVRWREGFDVENALEVFLDRVYAADVRGKLVIDVGASVGDSALFFASEGARRVIALEPHPESFALARRNVERSPFSGRITLLPVAAARQDGTVQLRTPGSVPNAASLAPAPAAEARWAFDRTIAVAARSLDALVLGSAPDGVGLLKLDVQGAEYDLVASLSEAAWGLIDAIVLEFTDGPRGLPDLLRAHGFETSTSGGVRGYLRGTRST